MFNPDKIKMDFPIFQNDQELVYLDNAATVQKPATVLKAIQNFYGRSYSNVHRGVYYLAEQADSLYDHARLLCADFINASAEEIVFVKNATEAANLLAYSYGETVLKAGDNIVVTALEHHSNFLPWQQLALRRGAEFRVAPINLQNWNVNVAELEKLIDKKTKILAITQMSNVLGTFPDLLNIINIAHLHGTKVVVDAAQGISHLGLDVQAMDCDFALVTGHKIFGPMCSGFLYGKKALLERAGVFMTGGGMTANLKENYLPMWSDLPVRLEAGTPNVAAAIGLGAAIEYLKTFNLPEVLDHDRDLVMLTHQELVKFPRVHIWGPAKRENLTSIVSFDIEGAHPHDVASILANDSVCIRAGHHCAKPLMMALHKQATNRVSYHMYNTEEDVYKLVRAVEKVLNIFK